VGQCLRAEKKNAEARQIFERAFEIGQRLHGPEHASHALNHLCIARCNAAEGRTREAIQVYAKALEIWEKKTPEECLAEMPELPNKERLGQVQQQAKAELAQLLMLVEQMNSQAVSEGAPASEAARAGYGETNS